MKQVLILLLLFPLTTCRKEEREQVQAPGPGFAVEITNPGFRLAIRDEKRVVLPAHKNSGLSFLGSPAVSSEKLEQGRSKTTWRVTNADGKTATVLIEPRNHAVLVHVRLDDDAHGEISMRTKSPGAAFGLGDHGSYGPSANLALEQKSYPLKHDGGIFRWISSFLVFPERGVAGAFFDRGGGSVEIGPDTWTMGNADAKEQTFHYFVGTMPEIYTAFFDARIANGYPGVEPKPEAFELGWESWDPLRWNTKAQTVTDAAQKFLDEGYPLHWMVIGSGFWRPGGTTVHFGEWDDAKYPGDGGRRAIPLDPGRAGFDHRVRLLIGQRTSFIPPGGPYSSKPGQSGATLFETSPDTAAALKGDYFLTGPDGNPIERVSPYFPTVPCHVLDGNQPNAPEFFEHHFRRWKVDGIKEDTMLKLPDHTIFNGPMRALAKNDNLVIARCGAYSSPGTLTRINDTHGPSNMTLRAPINFLQYAACGAPNVYADSVGMAHMKDPQAALRHAWLCATTAGMSVGVGPWDWSAKDRAIYRKAVDFHDSLAPYLYGAALESYGTGYPHTLTPLPIAYPDDKATYNLASKEKRQFQWMIGPSLLATPLLHDRYRSSDEMDIYLPAGSWIDWDSGVRYEGPRTLRKFKMPLEKTPVFVGGKGVVILRTREDDQSQGLRAFVYPIAPKGSVYRQRAALLPGYEFTVTNKNDGWNTATLKVTESNSDGSSEVAFDTHAASGAISFPVQFGGSYELTGGG